MVNHRGWGSYKPKRKLPSAQDHWLTGTGHKPSSPTRAKILAQGADERQVCGSEIVTSPARRTINPAA
jgi:hypothetical protein